MKSKYSTEDWSELDSAAKANLSAHDQAEFVRYKEQLRREGHAWDNDAHDILAGFIWEQSSGLVLDQSECEMFAKDPSPQFVIDRSGYHQTCFPLGMDTSGLVEISCISDEWARFVDPQSGRVIRCEDYWAQLQSRLTAKTTPTSADES